MPSGVCAPLQSRVREISFDSSACISNKSIYEEVYCSCADTPGSSTSPMANTISPRRPAEVSFANFKPWFNRYATIQLLHRTDGRALPTRLLVDRVCRSSRSSPLQAPQARLAKLRFSHTPSISSGKLTATSSRPNTVARQPHQWLRVVKFVESGPLRVRDRKSPHHRMGEGRWDRGGGLPRVALVPRLPWISISLPLRGGSKSEKVSQFAHGSCGFVTAAK